MKTKQENNNKTDNLQYTAADQRARKRDIYSYNLSFDNELKEYLGHCKLGPGLHTIPLSLFIWNCAYGGANILRKNDEILWHTW